MTQIEPEFSQPPSPVKKRKYFMRGMLTAVILVAAGSIAFMQCPFLYPLPSAQPSPVLKSPSQDAEIPLHPLPEEISVAKPPLVTNELATADAIKDLQAQITALQNQNNQGHQSSRKWVAAAMAFWDLRDTASQGHAFASQLAVLRANADDDAALLEQARALEPYADEGVPTFAQLRDRLPALEGSSVTAPDRSDQTLLGRIKALMHPLISVHPLHDMSADALENALDDKDGARALSLLKDLPKDTQDKVSPWRTDLEKRIALDQDIHNMAAVFTAAPTQDPTP